MKKTLLAIILCLLFPLSALAANPESLDLAGLNSMLAKNRDKVVMINFFATWCPPCRIELPEIVDLRKFFGQGQLLIVGLSVDENPAAVPDFIQSADVNYPVYMAKKDITDKFGVSSVPHNTFFAPGGKMVISEPGMADANVLKQVVQDLLKGK